MLVELEDEQSTFFPGIEVFSLKDFEVGKLISSFLYLTDESFNECADLLP